MLVFVIYSNGNINNYIINQCLAKGIAVVNGKALKLTGTLERMIEKL